MTRRPTITLHRAHTGRPLWLDVTAGGGELRAACARPLGGWPAHVPSTAEAAVLTPWGWDYVEEDLETIEGLTDAARQAVAGAA